MQVRQKQRERHTSAELIEKSTRILEHSRATLKAYQEKIAAARKPAGSQPAVMQGKLKDG
jgi:hypothetical protein